MLQVYYLNLENSNLPQMKPCLSAYQLHLSFFFSQRSLMLRAGIFFDGTSDRPSKVNGSNNLATDIREHNFNQAEGIQT
jgi:hypothetical protein